MSKRGKREETNTVKACLTGRTGDVISEHAYLLKGDMHSRMKARTSVTSRASVRKDSFCSTCSMTFFVADLHLVNYTEVNVEGG